MHTMNLLATTQAADKPVAPCPLSILFDRSATLAYRVKAGDLPFIEAVDMAYSAADFAGLIQRYGDDAIQKVLAKAFAA
jgi:hypothetical protein